MLKGKEPLVISEITSRLVSLSRASSMRVVGYVDEGAEAQWNERVVILAPRYGETKKNNLELAYYLVANGFKVLRIDQTNHFGESDGSIDQFTLPGAAEDLLAAVEYLDHYFEPDELILVASSISARCALRASALDHRISRVISVVGVVDLDSTLQAIYQRDIFGEFETGAEWESIDILGFEIEAANFHSSVVDSGMQNLAGTLQDAKQIQVPVLFLYAERDLWVDLDSVKQVLAACAQGELKLVPNVGHELNEKSEAVQFSFDALLGFCRMGAANESAPLAQACKKKLIEQNRVERGRLQKLVAFSDTEGDFWADYLGKFGIMEQAKYYVEYFATVGGLLGRLSSGDVIVDAGCGNGFYGVSVLRALAHATELEVSPIHYCGIDLTHVGLGRSYSRHVDELVDFQRDSLHDRCAVSFSYRKLDFDSLGGDFGAALPLADASVSKVCSSLVISYLKDPRCFMREIYRVLKPGGVAVFSSMKPGCDMTVVYHDSVAAAYSEENDRDAKVLLSAAGRIKVKKDVGMYHFYKRSELQALAVDAGFENTKVHRSFGDQANVIRVVR